MILLFVLLRLLCSNFDISKKLKIKNSYVSFFFQDLSINPSRRDENCRVKDQICIVIGTQQKCKACEKTVYPVELLSADGVDYHKSCFKCSHCKRTLKLSNYSSMEGVLYCKPHFEQLFKETGSLSKNFQTPAKSAKKLTAEMHQGKLPACSQEHKINELLVIRQHTLLRSCIWCERKRHYGEPENVTVENQSYHKSCFKCSHGGCPLSPSNYAALDGILYCKPHFFQLFKEKGSYNHLINSASMKRPTATDPDS